jgi:hypothetical protein
MKRVPVPLLTEEDGDVWLWVVHRWPMVDGAMKLRSLAAAHDHGDAALMLQMCESGLIPVYETIMSGGAHKRVVWWEFNR